MRRPLGGTLARPSIRKHLRQGSAASEIKRTQPLSEDRERTVLAPVRVCGGDQTWDGRPPYHTDMSTDMDMDMDRDRDTARDRDRDRDKRQRQRDRETERQRDRQRQRHAHTHTLCLLRLPR
eukprot:833115-Rhodomonas_salina.2